jgi:hypothetical protein
MDLVPHLSVALYLTVVSALEYAVVRSAHVGAGFLKWVLLLFLGMKLLGVLLVYMRLHLGPPGLQALACAVALAVVYSGWELMLSVPSRPAPSDTEALVPGRPPLGRALSVRFGCNSCHSIPGVAVRESGLCPDLAGVADRAATRRPGYTADAYLRESVEDPDAYVVPGYLPLMPALRDRMTRQQYEDLIAFLKTLHH